MRMISCIVLFACTLAAVAGPARESTAILERSVGRVILVNDKYPYAMQYVSSSIEKEYKSVRKLPVQQRVRFFWSVLMHVRLDASYSVDFVELIARDCPEEFERAISTFLKTDSEFGPTEPQASIAKRTLATLQLLRARNESHPPAR